MEEPDRPAASACPDAGHHATKIHNHAETITGYRPVVPGSAWRDELSAWLSATSALSRGPEAAADVAAPLLDRAGGQAMPRAAAVAAWALGRLGRLDEAMDAASRSHTAHLALPETIDWSPWIHLWFQSITLSLTGRFDQAHALATAECQTAVNEHSPEGQAYFACLRSARPNAGSPRPPPCELGKPPCSAGSPARLRLS